MVAWRSQCELQAGGVPDGTLGARFWLAAYTRPRHEERVTEFCHQRGIEAFLPLRAVLRRWSDRKKTLKVPLFPSYVFVRADETERRRAVQAPGLLWFVHSQSGPVHVAEAELHALRLALASGLDCDPLPNAQIGDEVEITAGALRGCRGRLLRKDAASILLIVSAINGGVRVALPDASWVSTVARSTASIA